MTSSFGKTVSQVCGKLSATFKIINNEVVKRIRTLSIETLFYSETVAIATNMGRRGILSDLDKNQNIKVSLQAIGKFSNKIDTSHLDKIVKTLQSYFPKIRRIFAVDGSVLSLSKLINMENPLFNLTPSGSYATASLTCIFDVIQKIPIAFNLRPTGDERKGFMALIDHLKKGDLVIFDRGYFDIKLVKALKARKINFIFRLKKDSLLLKQAIGTDVKVKLENFYLRKITYVADETTFYLLTNLSYKDNWSAIADFYHLRWTIETWYKTLKIELGGYFYNFKSLKAINNRIYWQIITSTLISLVAEESTPHITVKKKEAGYEIGKHYLLHHSATIFNYFVNFSKKNLTKLNNRFISFGETCLTHVEPFRKCPRIAIINKKQWYRNKTNKNNPSTTV